MKISSKIITLCIIIVLLLLFLYFNNEFEGLVLNVKSQSNYNESMPISGSILPGAKMNNNLQSTCMTLETSNNKINVVPANKRPPYAATKNGLCGTTYDLSGGIKASNAYCTLANNANTVTNFKGICKTSDNKYYNVSST